MSFAVMYALYFAALAMLAYATPSGGLRLLFALLALVVGVGVVNVMIEAVVFGLLDVSEVWMGSVFNVSMFVFLSLLALLLTGRLRAREAPAAAPPRLTVLRCLAVIAAYVVVYFAAGMAVFPFVADHYRGTEIPALPELLALQAFRGAIYLLAAIPLLKLGLRPAGLMLGLAFVIIAGLAPLSAENELMPAYVRAYHAIEIAVSNFAFGLFMGWILAPAPREAERESEEVPDQTMNSPSAPSGSS